MELSDKLRKAQERLESNEEVRYIFQIPNLSLRNELNSGSEEKYSTLNAKYDQTVKALDAARQAQSEEAEKAQDLEERISKIQGELAAANSKIKEREEALADAESTKAAEVQAVQETKAASERELSAKIQTLGQEYDVLKLQAEQLAEELRRTKLDLEEHKTVIAEQKRARYSERP
ncbi:hypothetical protein BDZ91DRAFT_520852 [Kalaharituber pfeilii]|nr:hypothetical protein BDZ91DRAFT_520852 [Kalaharituber pfeilii]